MDSINSTPNGAKKFTHFPQLTQAQFNFDDLARAGFYPSLGLTDGRKYAQTVNVEALQRGAGHLVMTEELLNLRNSKTTGICAQCGKHAIKRTEFYD